MTSKVGSRLKLDAQKSLVFKREGQGGTVVCATETPWQWCYWELTQPSHERPPLLPADSDQLVAFEGDGMASRGHSGSFELIDTAFTDEGDFTEMEDGRIHVKRWSTFQNAGTMDAKAAKGEYGDVSFNNTEKSCGIHLADATKEKFQVSTFL